MQLAISKEAKAKYDRERYLRLGPRQQNRDKAAKAAYDKARRAALYVDQRRTDCAREGCHNAVTQPRRGRRLYCSDACRSGQFYGVHASTREPMAAPYTGHQWLEAARAAVAPGQTEFGWELYDRYNDEMGEALLALLEGGDPKAAVVEFRKREFIPRYMTTHFSEWASEEQEWRLEEVVPRDDSAEDVAIARETVQTYARRLPRVHWGTTKGKMGTPRQATPTNRRQNAA